MGIAIEFIRQISFVLLMHTECIDDQQDPRAVHISPKYLSGISHVE